MKICLAQCRSTSGVLFQNIQTHLVYIECAVAWGADFIVFPELSLTGYEPTLAEKLAREADDPIFDCFQIMADEMAITIATGMPIKTRKGIVIGMIIFQPNIQRTVYAKQRLHEDELPFFVAGEEQIMLNIKDRKMVPAICYEALQREHFLKAHQAGATIYLASVAKSNKGILKAYSHFSDLATEFSTPILMVNSVGYADDFLAAGQTAVWNREGRCIGKLDEDRSGILLVDIDSWITEKKYFKMTNEAIQLARSADLPDLVQLFLNAKKHLDQQAIFQWTDHYPSSTIIEKDLEKGTLYILKKDKEVIGGVTLNEDQDIEYQSVDWKFGNQKVLVIHRLAIDPIYQGRGYAKKMMDFAEAYAIENNYDSIRLDTYTQNKVSFEFYKKRNYILRGEVSFPGRKHPFYCLEKNLKPNFMNLLNRHP